MALEMQLFQISQGLRKYAPHKYMEGQENARLVKCYWCIIDLAMGLVFSASENTVIVRMWAFMKKYVRKHRIPPIHTLKSTPWQAVVDLVA